MDDSLVEMMVLLLVELMASKWVDEKVCKLVWSMDEPWAVKKAVTTVEWQGSWKAAPMAALKVGQMGATMDDWMAILMEISLVDWKAA